MSIDTFFEEGLTIQILNKGNTTFKQIFSDLKEFNCFFTDGSKSPDSPFAGFSVIDVTADKTYKFRSSCKTSIFSCEALAIKSALEIAQNNGYHNIRIFSDSMSVLKAIQSSNKSQIKSNIILDIINIGMNLKNIGKRIELFWIPAHVGIEFNEKADRAAKEAIKSGIDTSTLIPVSDLQAHWKAELFENFYKWVKDIGKTKGIFFSKYLLTHKRKPWFHNERLNRRCIVSINRIRADHTSLAESLYKFKIVESPKCSCKEYSQSTNHIFWQCSELEKEREILLETIRKKIPIGPLWINDILHDMKRANLIAIEKFINFIPIKI